MIESLLFGGKQKELAQKRAQLLRRSVQVRHQMCQDIGRCAKPLSSVARISEMLIWPLQMIAAHPKIAISAAVLMFLFKPTRIIALTGVAFSAFTRFQKLMAPALMLLQLLPKRGTKS